jgi:hypothetical protein
MISDDCLKVCDTGLICYKNTVIHCPLFNRTGSITYLLTPGDRNKSNLWNYICVKYVPNEQEDILVKSDVFSYYWHLVRNMHCGYFFMTATSSINWKCYIVSPLYDTFLISTCVCLSLLIVSFWWQAGEIKWQVRKENGDGRLSHIPWRP